MKSFRDFGFRDVMGASRERLLRFLKWNDPNGAFADEDVRYEAGDPRAPVASLDVARCEVFWTLVQSTDEAKIGRPVTFDQLLAAYLRTAIDEIGTDIRVGRVPKKVGSFSDLHDYVDANLYGGSSLLLALYGMEAATEVLNLGAEAVTTWLKTGHINSDHSEW